MMKEKTHSSFSFRFSLKYTYSSKEPKFEVVIEKVSIDSNPV